MGIWTAKLKLGWSKGASSANADDWDVARAGIKVHVPAEDHMDGRGLGNGFA
jgi:hypothetical protein